MNIRRDIFIQKAKQIHGEKYNYSKVIYKHSHSKVAILCLIHGEFEQIPTNHLSGKGCPKCKTEKLSISLSSNANEFVKKS